MSAGRDAAVDRLMSGYAAHFVNDSEAEPAAANLARVLASCCRPPRAEEFPAIRRHVAKWRQGRALRLAGQRIERDGEVYEIALVHQGVTAADGTRGVPVHAVRTEGGVMVPGLENLAAFMLDAGEAMSGNVIVLAER